MALGRSLVLALALVSCHRPGALDPANAVGRRVATLSSDARRAALRHATIFDTVDPTTRDLALGPHDAHEFHTGDAVSCDFVEPRADRVPARGTTPKFFCTLRHGERTVVKIKYGRSNGEVYGEVLASRLLWALGFATDGDYAVRIRCHGCPEDPWISYRNFPRADPSAREVREIDDAIIQRLYPGALLQERVDEGWSFDELDAIDAPREQIEALRLLAAFIAHGDDKPENQRLVCPFDAIDDENQCRAPRLLIADLGSTFGRGVNGFGLIDQKSRPSYAAWSALPMWEDRATCRAHFAARSSRSNPVIGEAGRQFLASRLAALSHVQIRALFAAARIERMGETTRDEAGRPRSVTIDDWTAAFEKRRAEIQDARCPARPG